MRRLAVVLLCVLFAPAAVHAENKGDPATGRVIAERWCSACHLVSPRQTSASADVLTFMAIAAKTGSDLKSLEAFLADPHPLMADPGLTRREIGDLVAYIASLR